MDRVSSFLDTMMTIQVQAFDPDKYVECATWGGPLLPLRAPRIFPSAEVGQYKQRPPREEKPNQ